MSLRAVADLAGITEIELDEEQATAVRDTLIE
jgi:hypothetical protein